MNKEVSKFFIKYQKDWLNDHSQIKLASKSRRIGFTWIQSFEDVKDALSLKIRNKPCDVWFTSADISAAKEYINYCKFWAKAFNKGVEDLGEIIIDEEKGIKALSLEFENGARINAISSNPSAFRSKGGKVVIDEFAFHKNPVELWKAARPVITWGYPLRIISSLNGTNNLFYKFIEKIKKGKLNWSLHEVDIYKAVKDGLVDKIYGRKTTKQEREAWLNDLKESCGDEVTWQQEFCCIAVDEASSFITFDLINNCVEDTLIDDLSNISNDFYLGFDVARKKDLSAIVALEKMGAVFYLRKKFELKNVKYAEQKELVRKLLSNSKCRKLAIDATGIGNQLAEEIKEEFGSRMVEPIMFAPRIKEEMAYKLLYAFQDRNIRFPDDEDIKNDIHSVKRLNTTANGIVRFDADRSETDGHADRFWAFALAIYAGTNQPYQKPEVLYKNSNNYKCFDNEFNLRGIGGILRSFN